ncbi:MAG TPA: hypothetical protein VFC53_13320 [Dehalococcoidia bacterium]|jgi:hypothetical protein|nr:hypothetical protein [Dehalococcoidia bacterium]
MPLILLLALMLSMTAMRVFMPIGAKVEGKPFAEIALTLRERLLLQRTNMYLVGAVILLGALTGMLTGPLETVAVLAMFAILTIPARYRFTSQGVALNNVVFRRWSEFSGYREERARLVLEAKEERDFRIVVTGTNAEAAKKALSGLLPKSTRAKTPRGRRIGVEMRPHSRS